MMNQWYYLWSEDGKVLARRKFTFEQAIAENDACRQIEKATGKTQPRWKVV